MMGRRPGKRPSGPEALMRRADELRLGTGGEQNFEEAFILYRKAALKGAERAYYVLGCMCEAGQGTAQSYKKAYQWYDRGARLNDHECMASLGFLYEAGLGTKHSRALAIENLETAANAGLGRAQNNLGLIYLDRNNAEHSEHAAVTLFQKGNMNGYVPAVANLARMYEKGIGMARRCDTAANLFKTAAKGGSITAKKCLAEMYKYGIGIEPSEKYARHIFLDAARWGDRASQAEISGEDYEDEAFGPGPKRAQNDPRTQLSLGLAFLDGGSTLQSVPTAMYLLEASARGGNTTAMYVMGQIYERGLFHERSKYLAMKWYRWGADKGHGPCAYNLGCMYEDGVGVPHDPQLALEMYRRSADCEQDEDAESDALYAYASLLQAGIGTEEERSGYLALFIRSADLGHAGAQYIAGKMLADNGDPTAAKKYLKMASDQGDGKATELLDSL